MQSLWLLVCLSAGSDPGSRFPAASTQIASEIIDIAVQVHEATIMAGGYPSPLNYYSFPKSVCTSVNEVIHL